MIQTSSGWSITFDDGQLVCGNGRAGPLGEASVRFTSCKRCGLAHFTDTNVPADVEHAVNRETKRFTYLRCVECGHGIDCRSCDSTSPISDDTSAMTLRDSEADERSE